MPGWKDRVRNMLGDSSQSAEVTHVPNTAAPVVTAPETQTVQDAVRQFTLESPRLPLDEQVEVVGETYHVKGLKRVYADRGVPITDRGCSIDDAHCILVPEPWNPHDTSAVAVLVGEHQVGYLPAELAATYSDALGRLARKGTLATGEARIWAKSDKGLVRGRVTVLIPEAAAFG